MTRRKNVEKTKATCSFGNDEYGLQTGNVKISELHDFKGHPFKVEQDIQLFELMRSIEDKGVLVPLIVRSNPYGDGYEIIAGHRRKAACTWAGIDEVPVIVRELDDADAVIAMIDPLFALLHNSKCFWRFLGLCTLLIQSICEHLL